MKYFRIQVGFFVLFSSQIEIKFLNCTLKIKQMDNYKKISREEFMIFFVIRKKTNELTNDNRIDIIWYILAGSSDFTKILFDEILIDYCMHNIDIVDVNNGKEN